MSSSDRHLRHILLVDDNTKDLELTCAAFAQAGLKAVVVTARDGVQALDYLLRRGEHAGRTSPNPAVVLLDLKMPRMDGLTALQTIRAHASTCVIPVVVLASSRDEADLVRSYEHGANAYIIKPDRPENFLGTMRGIGMFWTTVNQSPLRTGN